VVITKERVLFMHMLRVCYLNFNKVAKRVKIFVVRNSENLVC